MLQRVFPVYLPAKPDRENIFDTVSRVSVIAPGQARIWTTLRDKPQYRSSTRLEQFDVRFFVREMSKYRLYCVVRDFTLNSTKRNPTTDTRTQPLPIARNKYVTLRLTEIVLYILHPRVCNIKNIGKYKIVQAGVNIVRPRTACRRLMVAVNESTVVEYTHDYYKLLLDD